MLASSACLREPLVGQEQMRVEPRELVAVRGQLVEVDQDDELRRLPEEDQAAAQVRDLVGMRESGLGEQVAEAGLGLVVAVGRGHRPSVPSEGLREARAARKKAV